MKQQNWIPTVWFNSHYIQVGVKIINRRHNFLPLEILFENPTAKQTNSSKGGKAFQMVLTNFAYYRCAFKERTLKIVFRILWDYCSCHFQFQPWLCKDHMDLRTFPTCYLLQVSSLIRVLTVFWGRVVRWIWRSLRYSSYTEWMV